MVDVDDFRKGEFDVYELESSGLTRADLSTVTLRSENGDDAWSPACLQIAFDGDLVYCQDEMGFTMGNDVDELTTWTDPDGLHKSCRSCWDSPLTHGPILGGPRADGADIWIRTDATRSARLEVEDSSTGESWIADWTYPLASTDFTATLTADGLSSDTDYAYTIVLEGEERVGPFALRTAPVLGEAHNFEVAFGSCSKYAIQPVFNAIANDNVDLFFFVGDNHYGNTSDLQSLRWNYRWAHSLDYRRQLMAEAGILATWDDHDYTGNNTDGSDTGKETALRVFQDYWANPSAGTPDTPGTFFAYSYGKVDFFFLDDRFYRGLNDSLLGKGQADWLVSAIQESSATFKVLISGSQWTSFGSTDSWAAFPNAKTELFEQLRTLNTEGLVLLSGDIHRSSFRLLADDVFAYPVPELTSSPLANKTTACKDDSELQSCYNTRPSYLHLSFQTEGDAPSLTARIKNDGGETEAEWVISRSSLTAP